MPPRLTELTCILIQPSPGVQVPKRGDSAGCTPRTEAVHNLYTKDVPARVISGAWFGFITQGKVLVYGFAGESRLSGGKGRCPSGPKAHSPQVIGDEKKDLRITEPFGHRLGVAMGLGRLARLTSRLHCSSWARVFRVAQKGGLGWSS